jgi:hypothetical protein
VGINLAIKNAIQSVISQITWMTIPVINRPFVVCSAAFLKFVVFLMAKGV